MKATYLSLSLALMAVAGNAQSTYSVPADFATIKAAMGAAVHGDTILVSPGVYPEVNLNPGTKRITIKSTGGPEVTIIDSGYAGRCFWITSAITSEFVLDGFMLYRGSAPTGGGTIGDGGGGLLIQNGDPTIRNCIIRACKADDGSARTGTFVGYRGGYGGGVYLTNGSPRFDNCRFESNQAGRGGAGGDGVDGYFGSYVTAPSDGTDGETGGLGGHGGAVYMLNSSPTFVNCIFENNSSGQGGIGGDGGLGGEQSLWVFGSSGNGGNAGDGGRGGEGGAIYANSSAPAVINCTVLTNSLGSGGPPGTPGLAGAGISQGTNGVVGSYGAQFNWGGGQLSGGSAMNSIFWGNDGGEITGLLIEYSCVEGGWIGTGNIDSPPVVSTLTGLAGSSPCIDTGINTAVPTGVTEDLVGNPRFIDDPLALNTGAGVGTPVDMGAMEYFVGYVLPLGCATPSGSLALSSGTPTPGATLSFQVTDDEQRMGARAALIVGMAGSPTACGTATRGGNLLIDTSQPYSLLLAQAPGVQTIDLVLPNETSLLGMSLFVQGASLAPLRAGKPGSGAPLAWSLLEAVQLVVGP
jgi:hypothetical protein